MSSLKGGTSLVTERCKIIKKKKRDSICGTLIDSSNNNSYTVSLQKHRRSWGDGSVGKLIIIASLGS